MFVFAIGRHDKTMFAQAVNAFRPSTKAEPEHVEYMYSNVERGRYGLGRLFWVHKQEGTEQEEVTVIRPVPYRGR